jgi:hypothetical protein
MKVEFTIPLLKLPSVANLREHWTTRANRARRCRHVAAIHAMRALPMAAPRSPVYWMPCLITITRVSPRSLDGDNLQAACKALRDGIADALMVDDADPRVEWHYAQRRGGVAVEISIESP